MNSDLGFSKSTLVLIVVGISGVWWVLEGVPIPFPSSQHALAPSASLSTYEEKMAKQMSREKGRQVKPAEVATMVLEGVAYSLISSANDYLEEPCDLGMRRYVVGRINHYYRIKRRFPEIVVTREKQLGLPISDTDVRQAIANLALQGQLVPDDFDAATQQDIGQEMFPAVPVNMMQRAKCQAAG